MPSKELWLPIANKYQEHSSYPTCLGLSMVNIANDSMFLNCKHYFSVVLMVVVDSDYNFIFVDIGPTNHLRTPVCICGEEAVALHYHLLRPFGGHELDQLKRTFNYRLTRARRYVESAFGILSNEWRIFHRPMNVSFDLAVDIVITCVLQNFIHEEECFHLHNVLKMRPHLIWI
nr:unnamed protein product [Callosobruchus analis]